MSQNLNNPIQKLLELQGFAVLDGALATELEARGASLKDNLWSAKVLRDNPSLIRQVHYDYFCHGADIATTATYQATFEGFAKSGWDKKAAIALFQLSVQLAFEARDLFWKTTDPQKRAWPLVAASIGPYGAMRSDGSEYTGDYGLDVKTLMNFHRPRLEVLLESGADLLACETIPSILEAEAIIRLLEEYQETWAWLSFSCRDGQCISDGTSLKEAVQMINDTRQIAATGINCTAPVLISPLLKTIKAETTKPLLVYPNSGEGWDAVHKRWIENEAKLDLESKVQDWYREGACLIGGCCRTNPHDIALIRKTLIQKNR